MIKAERDPRVTLSYFDRGPGAKAIIWDVNRMERRYLPFLGFLSKPGLELPTLRTNQLGFRDEPLSPRQPGEVRVLLLGGSTSWGIGASSNEATVRGALERRLNERGSAKYRVMSGAFLGYTARQEMTVLTEFLEDFDPDIVVSLTGYNDVRTMMDDSGGILERPEARMLARSRDESATTDGHADRSEKGRRVSRHMATGRLRARACEYRRAASSFGCLLRSHPVAEACSARCGIPPHQRRVFRAAWKAIHHRHAAGPVQHGQVPHTRGGDDQEAIYVSDPAAWRLPIPQYRHDLASSLSVLPNVVFLDLRDRFDQCRRTGVHR